MQKSIRARILIMACIGVLSAGLVSSQSGTCSQTRVFDYKGEGSFFSSNSDMMTLYTQSIVQCTKTLQESLTRANGACAQFCAAQSTNQVACLPRPTGGKAECSIPSNMNAVCSFSTNPQAPGIGCKISDSDLLRCACVGHDKGPQS
jgi:hypothetical protein